MYNITEELVQKLIEDQFPQYIPLPIRPVPRMGHDNRSFRLGNDLLVRLPSAEGYERQVDKEQTWLPILGPYLPLPIPKPIALGQPSPHFPWKWSIYKWLEGQSANSIEIDDESRNEIAQQLAYFLKEFHKFDPKGAPVPGLHNYWRAAHTSVYDEETRSLIIKLRDVIDSNKATSLWEKAVSSQWEKDPVWVHGDVASGNILVKERKLSAVIDFGCMGIGDPACDLTIAWTFFKNKSRKSFQNSLNLDSDTWARARGWALWKALYQLSQTTDTSSPQSKREIKTIQDIFEENEV